MDSTTEGLSVPVLNRAELSRTGVIFVALMFAICATGAVAREFRAADTQAADYPTVQALRYMGALIAERTGGRHRKIDDAAADERTAIVDAALDGATTVGHLEHAAERARPVRAGQLAAFAGFSVSVI